MEEEKDKELDRIVRERYGDGEAGFQEAGAVSEEGRRKTEHSTAMSSKDH